MDVVVQTEKLTKSYGPHRGVVEVDLSVNQGEVFRFLGPNGAGKTTTIRNHRRSGGHPQAGRLPARRVFNLFEQGERE